MQKFWRSPWSLRSALSWRPAETGDNTLVLTLPESHRLRGLYEVTLTADISGRMRQDDGEAYRVGGRDSFILVSRGARRMTLELDTPTAPTAIILRPRSVLHLARAIVRRKDVPRRRAMASLLQGKIACAIDLIGHGALAAGAAYRAWLDRFEPKDQGARITAHMAQWSSHPTFSVIMTTWNSAIPFLRAAIESVQGQHYPHWRLIVADDASDDPRVVETLHEFASRDARISIVRLPENGGIANATNAALAEAKGDWIAFLDHDDLLSRDALAIAADAILRQPGARIIYTDEDIDSAVTAELAELAKTGLVDGVTTNPSLIAKAGQPILATLKTICGIIPGPVSAEAVATDAEGLVAEGRKLMTVAPNIVVKLPLTVEGLRACQTLTAEGARTNVTLCFSAVQAMLAAKAGATYISPFIGRLDDGGHDGMELIREIRAVYDNYGFATKILAASIRTQPHLRDAALAGADCATIPPAIFKAAFHHPLTDAGLEAFEKDWKASGQTIL